MKRISVLLLLLCIQKVSLACDVCKDKQPEALSGITHGTGPNSNVDYFIIWSAVILVSFTLFYSIKYLIKPEPKNSQHIKNIVTNEYL